MIDKIYMLNFFIITYIEHGKSTLLELIIEYCATISSRDVKDQILDSMDIERERCIEINS